MVLSTHTCRSGTLITKPSHFEKWKLWSRGQRKGPFKVHNRVCDSIQQNWNSRRVGEEPLRVISAEKQKAKSHICYQLQLEARAEPVCTSVRCGRGSCRAFQNQASLLKQERLVTDLSVGKYPNLFQNGLRVAISEETGMILYACLKYTSKKMSWGVIFSALSYSIWIDHNEIFSCIFRNHWREKNYYMKWLKWHEIT